MSNRLHGNLIWSIKFQIRAGIGEAKSEEGVTERAHDRPVLRGGGRGAPAALRLHSHRNEGHAHVHRRDAGGAARFRLREGALHRRPPADELVPDRINRRRRLRRRLCHGQGRPSHLMQ